MSLETALQVLMRPWRNALEARSWDASTGQPRLNLDQWVTLMTTLSQETPSPFFYGLLCDHQDEFLAHLPPPGPERDASLAVLVRALNPAPDRTLDPEHQSFLIGLAQAALTTEHRSELAFGLCQTALARKNDHLFLKLVPMLAPHIETHRLMDLLDPLPPALALDTTPLPVIRVLGDRLTEPQRGRIVALAVVNNWPHLGHALDPEGTAVLPSEVFEAKAAQRELIYRVVGDSSWSREIRRQIIQASPIPCVPPMGQTVESLLAFVDGLDLEGSVRFGEVDFPSKHLATRLAAWWVLTPVDVPPDMARFSALLGALGHGPYSNNRREFIEELMVYLTTEDAIPKPLAPLTYPLVPSPEGSRDARATASVELNITALAHRRADQDLWARRAAMRTMATRLNWAELPRVAFHVLNEIAASPVLSQWYDDLLPLVGPSDQGVCHSLLLTATTAPRWGQAYNALARGRSPDLVADASPEVVGGTLLRLLHDGGALRGKLADPAYWPQTLPIVAFRDARVGAALRSPTLSEAQRERLGERLQAMDQALGAAMDNPMFPLELRQRLYASCRVVRPHIAEDRYRAEDRQKALHTHPAAAPRPRRRS